MSLSINDKLKLITEGYSIEDINTGNVNLVSLVQETAVNETSLFFEAVSVDLQFMCETSVEYLTESALDTLKDKIVKMINWFIEKIKNIIKWIKEKFFNKSNKTEKVIKSIKQKEKTGELKAAIKAIENNDNKEIKEDKDKLRVNAYENIFKEMKPISQYSDKISKIGDTALNNFRNNKPILDGIFDNIDLTNREEVTKIIMKNITGQVDDLSKFKEFYLGTKKIINLNDVDISKIEETYSKLGEEGSKVGDVYEDYLDKFNKWKDDSIRLIDEAKANKATTNVNTSQIQKNINQMTTVYSIIIKILNKISSDWAVGRTNLDDILIKLDSL